MTEIEDKIVHLTRWLSIVDKRVATLESMDALKSDAQQLKQAIALVRRTVISELSDLALSDPFDNVLDALEQQACV